MRGLFRRLASAGVAAAAVMACGVAAALAAPLPAPEAGASACPPPPKGTIAYGVFHKGERIGRVAIDVSGGDGRALVRTTVELDVHLWILPVLTFRHRSEAWWEGGAFSRFAGRTVDNGREYVVRAEPAGAGLRVETNGFDQRRPAGLLIDALWCPEALAFGRLVNPMKGRLTEFVARDLGTDAVPYAGRSHAARRYAITHKDRTGDLWYGADGIALKATFLTRRGNPVVLLRE